jgi:hypothetical protein
MSAGRSRKQSSRKASCSLLGGAAITCVVLGCGWTVYSNILSASVYPTIGGAGYGEPVVKQGRNEPTRDVAQAINQAFAALTEEAPARPEVAAPVTPSIFSERFAASEPTSVPSRAAEAAPPPEASKVTLAPNPLDAPKIAEVAKPKEVEPKQQVAMIAPPASHPLETKPAAKADGMSLRDMADRAKAAMLSITSGGRLAMVEKLWGKRGSQGSLLAYASADVSVAVPVEHNQNPLNGGSPPYDRDTAVYDISAHTVYLPDGTKLEAHSGLGSDQDDPRSARARMRGVTPPHIYELTPREALFHGVAALRLNPIGGEDSIYGRSGLLAHTFMLGSNGASNGCVSFRDYSAFLNAYRNMGIRKLAVVARID